MTQSRRYSGVAMLLHWLIAVAVIVNWRLAEAAENAVRSDAIAYMANHKATGITILALTLVRLAWRLVHRPPPLRDGMAAWEKALSRTVHIAFYILLVALPLIGWAAESYEGHTVDIWGLFTLPALPVGENEALSHTLEEIHGTGGTVMLALIALHIIGMLKHMFIDKDGNLWRMLPVGQPRG